LFEEGARPKQAIAAYEPVMYKVVHRKEDLRVKESIIDIQEGFLNRTERLLKMHYKRSHIHDGLKYLQNEEVIQKVTESPTKLKQRAKAFLRMLEKHKIRLDLNGEVDYRKCEDENVVAALKKKEQLVKVTLMQADLEFEYPQKLEKIVVKNEILNWLANEEEKLKNIAIEFAIEQEARQKSQTKLTPGDEFYLTYEDYYGNTDMVGSSSLSSLKFRQNEKTKMSYESFMSSYASKNIFDNDLLEM
jgi:hypothetical protein